MGEIKISVSETTDKIIQKIADDLGIKKAEYVKGVVIESLKKFKTKGGGK